MSAAAVLNGVRPWPGVVIINNDPPTPTFHAHGKFKGTDAYGTFRTKCGLRSATWQANRVPSLTLNYQTAWLRRDHAAAIGKPCGKCFRNDEDAA